MKDSGVAWIGEIPEGWEVGKFKSYASICNGLEAKDVIDEDGGYPIIGSGGEFGKSATFLYDQDSVLLGRKGTIDKPIFMTTPFWVVDTMFFTKIRSSVFPKFFYYLCISIPFDLFKSGSTLPSMTATALNNIDFPLPSKAEQTQIANYLDRKCAQIDQAIALVDQSIEKLKAYRQSVITEAVTRGLDPEAKMKDSGVEWIGEICSSFQIARLQNLLLIPLQYGANASGISFSENIPRYIRITDIDKEGKLKNDDMQSLTLDIAYNYLLSNEDILFARSGATAGKTFYYLSEYGKSAFAGYLIRAKIDITKALPKFIYYYTLSLIYSEWIKLIFSQSTIQNINAEKYSNMYLPFPPFSIQSQIIQFLDRKCAQIDDLISQKQSLRDKLTAYKKSLIYECVTGKREVSA